MFLFARLIALLCLLSLTPGSAFGWWETGHRAVARLAAHHLHAAARTRVARILSVADTPEAVADALALVSTWADETRADNNTGPWHYIDLTLQDSRSNFAERCEYDDCVTARIRLFAAQLADQNASGRWSEADALRFIVHFVGDIHQPLHAASDADLGGNCEPLNPPMGDARNLHSLWDGIIVNSFEAGDKQLAENLESYVQSLGGKLPSGWSMGSAEDWAWESHEIAIEKIYQRLHIPTEPVLFPAGCTQAPADIQNIKLHVDTLYVDDMKPVVRDQLTKAGLRLAQLLNQTF